MGDNNLRLYLFFKGESEETLVKAQEIFYGFQSEMLKKEQIEDNVRSVEDQDKKSIVFILIFKNQDVMEKFAKEEKEKMELNIMSPFDQKEQKVSANVVIGEIQRM